MVCVQNCIVVLKTLVILHFNNSIGSPVVYFDALSHVIESVE